MRKSSGGVKIKKPGPTYSPAGEGSTLGRLRIVSCSFRVE